MHTLQKAIKIARQPKQAWDLATIRFLERVASTWNVALDLRRRRGLPHNSGNTPFDEIREHSLIRTDINDHLPTLFAEALTVEPKVIVELGVRGGESTLALERVAGTFGSALISVDIDDCSRVSRYPKRWFVKSDDVAFARQFPAWCSAHALDACIDVLFIDTSHEREHTVQEIAGWFPFLSERSKVFFHDTNMQRLYRRKDGSLGVGWSNRRGVISALEDRLGCLFDETRDFTSIAQGWMVRHHAGCNGLIVLERLPRNAVSTDVAHVAYASV